MLTGLMGLAMLGAAQLGASYERETALYNASIAGNYDEAYSGRMKEFRRYRGDRELEDAYLLGYFASYEDHEVPYTWRDRIVALRASGMEY